MLAAGDQNRRARSRPIDARARDAPRGRCPRRSRPEAPRARAGSARDRARHRPSRCPAPAVAGSCGDAERAQRHAHMRIALAGADIRHDLARLQAAILGRAAGPALEEFEQREIEILVQRLARAHDLVAVIERALDAGDRHIDGERLRIGLGRRPVMRRDGMPSPCGTPARSPSRAARRYRGSPSGAPVTLSQPVGVRSISSRWLDAQAVRREDLVLGHAAVRVFERDTR